MIGLGLRYVGELASHARVLDIVDLVDHDNLVRIVASGQLDDGRAYLAMEPIEGQALSRRIAEEGALPVEEVRRIAVDLCAALAELHEAGIVHRDVKPENVIVRPDGSAVLTDLGLARSALFKTVTRHEIAVGTLAYMSPEQSLGRSLDGRTDLWSLGVLLYEALTGVRPFDGDHELALLYAIHNVPVVPIEDRRADVPADLVEVIGECLKRDDADRPTSAQRLRERLLASGEQAQDP